MSIDDLDIRLISALRRDGRRSISDLSIELGVTRATVRARMDRLRERGDVLGYTIVLKQDRSDLPIRASMMLRVDAKRTKSILRILMGVPEAQSVYSTNGRWDLMVNLAATDLAIFDSAIERIRLIDGVSATETNLLLTVHKRLEGS